MTLQHLNDLFMTLGYTKDKATNESKELMNKLDNNKDGFINLNEFHIISKYFPNNKNNENILLKHIFIIQYY